METPSSRTSAICSDDWFEQGSKAGTGHEVIKSGLGFFFQLVEVVLELFDGAGDKVMVSEVSPRYGVVAEDGVYELSHVVVKNQTREFEVVDEGGGGGRGGCRWHFNEG